MSINILCIHFTNLYKYTYLYLFYCFSGHRYPRTLVLEQYDEVLQYWSAVFKFDKEQAKGLQVCLSRLQRAILYNESIFIHLGNGIFLQFAEEELSISELTFSACSSHKRLGYGKFLAADILFRILPTALGLWPELESVKSNCTVQEKTTATI